MIKEKKPKWTVVLPLLFGVLVTVTNTAYAAGGKSVARYGETIVKEAFSNVTVTVSLTCIKASAFVHNRRMLWGDDATTGTPQNIIKSLEVSVGGVKLDVPLSAYIDLSDLREAAIIKTHEGYILSLQGGDAATSYVASLHFDNSKISKRKVESAELPDNFWEETNYKSDDSTIE